MITAEHPVLNKTIPPGAESDCMACDECFSSWNDILADLKEKTAQEVAKAEQVKSTGVAGAFYKSHFDEMEKKLDEIKTILAGASISNEELSAVQAEIDTISQVLASTAQELEGLDYNLAETKQSITQARFDLDFLKTHADTKNRQALDMKEEITKLQEGNVEGALNLTKEARSKSEEAKRKVDMVQMEGGLLRDSETQRRATESMINNTQIDFEDTQSQNQQTLDNIVDQIGNLESKIPGLNKQVCDGETSVDEPCDQLCGGAGCGKCGGISCLNGSLSMAEEAVKSADMADKLLKDKETSANRVLLEVTNAHTKALTAEREAQEARDLAVQAKDRSVGELERSTALTKQIEDFVSGEQASPADVAALADKVSF